MPCRVVVIAGCTGVGKSSAAVRLARSLAGEVVSADSVQVYKGLDIGSDKVPPEVQRQVPHHLVDILEPAEHEFAVGDFIRRARTAVNDICSRGRLPILCGGTGFYVSGLLYGGPPTPRRMHADRELENNLRKEMETAADWEASISQLRAVDPEYAANLHRNDYYRLCRALAVHMRTGTKVSDTPWTRGTRHEGSDGTLVNSHDVRPHFLTRRRLDIYRKVDARCEEMVAGNGQAGLIEETAELVAGGALREGSPAAKSIGYRQTIDFLKATGLLNHTPDDIDSTWLPPFRAYMSQFMKASRNLCKRQLTWYRNNHCGWYFLHAPIDTEKNIDEILERNTLCSPAEFLRWCESEGDVGVIDVLSGDELREMKAYQPIPTLFKSDDDVIMCLKRILTNQSINRLASY